MSEIQVTQAMSQLTAVPTVEVRRNGRLALVLGGLAGLLAVAFLLRRDGALDLILGLVLLAVGVAWLWAARDARTPVLLADDQGVRLRLGRDWRGIPWHEVDEVEHLPRGGMLRDGRLVVLPADPEAHESALTRSASLHARIATRLYGAPFAVPLGLTTLVVGGSRDLTSRLARLAGARATIVEIDPSLAEDDVDAAASNDEGDGHDEVTDERFAISDTAERAAVPAGPSTDADRGAGHVDPAVDPEREDTAPRERPRLFASPSPSPLREPVTAVRADLTRDLTHGSNALKLDPAETDRERSDLPEADELRRGPDVGEWPDGVSPIAKPGEPVAPIVVEDDAEPAPDPVIGPELAAARTRLGLSVDQLAERTRIRPHVIESIEVDDFAPCGGDFYARGHLRTLARVLAIDVAPLLAAYDERYADAPVDPRAVFEAELATGANGTIRRMRGGPNWSVLVAAVMALVLAWSIARLVMDGSTTPTPEVASLSNGSGGATNPYGKVAAPVPVQLTAAGGGAHVVVRDAKGDIVFTGDLAFGQTKALKVSPPIRVQSSDGSLTVSVDGAKAEPLGTTGETAQKSFTAR